MTVGDIPIAGMVNTINIPNSLGDWTYTFEDALDGGSTKDIIATIYGMGKLTGLIIRSDEDSGTMEADKTVIHIVVDGVDKSISMLSLSYIVGQQTGTHGPISFNEFDDTNNDFSVSFNFEIPFQWSLRVYVANAATAGNKCDIYAMHSYELVK